MVQLCEKSSITTVLAESKTGSDYGCLRFVSFDLAVGIIPPMSSNAKVKARARIYIITQDPRYVELLRDSASQSEAGHARPADFRVLRISGSKIPASKRLSRLSAPQDGFYDKQPPGMSESARRTDALHRRRHACGRTGSGTVLST